MCAAMLGYRSHQFYCVHAVHTGLVPKVKKNTAINQIKAFISFHNISKLVLSFVSDAATNITAPHFSCFFLHCLHSHW